MKFKKEIMLELEELMQEPHQGVKAVEIGEWIDGGKYQDRQIVFTFENKFYSLWESRSGSHYTDWYYDSDDWDDLVECSEVELKEVVTSEWVVKN